MLAKLNIPRRHAFSIAGSFCKLSSDAKKTINVTWVHKDGRETVTTAQVGINVMEAAHRKGIEVEGACEGSCACSTCHVILDRNVYNALPEPSETEEDMLDQAFGLTPTSRLGCQVILEEKHDGIKIKLPKATRNFYVVSFFVFHVSSPLRLNYFVVLFRMVMFPNLIEKLLTASESTLGGNRFLYESMRL